MQENIFWCPTDQCEDFVQIARANAVWCPEGHLMQPIGFIDKRGRAVETPIKEPKRVK